jgi:ABC-type ATPase involved in cell division
MRDPWRDEVLRRAALSNHGKPRFVLLCGHSGSGRKTILRRMAWDLRRQGTPSLDLLEEDLSLLYAQDISDLALAS